MIVSTSQHHIKAQLHTRAMTYSHIPLNSSTTQPPVHRRRHQNKPKNLSKKLTFDIESKVIGPLDSINIRTSLIAFELQHP